MKFSTIGKTIERVVRWLSGRPSVRRRSTTGAARRETAGSCKGPAFAAQFPCDISSYGRHYRVHDEIEFNELIDWLTLRKLKLANRYRIGASWPRGKRLTLVEATAHGRLWPCGDCGKRHWGRTLRCPVSARPRAVAEAGPFAAEKAVQ